MVANGISTNYLEAGIGEPVVLVHGSGPGVSAYTNWPLDTSLPLHPLIDNSQLHVFGRCGHWTQIEHSAAFSRLVADLLGQP